MEIHALAGAIVETVLVCLFPVWLPGIFWDEHQIPGGVCLCSCVSVSDSMRAGGWFTSGDTEAKNTCGLKVERSDGTVSYLIRR